MKSMPRTTCVLVTMMMLTAALARPEAARRQVPLRGAIFGQEVDVFQGPPPGTLAVDGSATVIATHLGRCTFTWNVTVDAADGSSSGFSQFTAANGDTLYATILGQGEPTETPGINRIVEINTITGGTGRFARAKGSFTMERLVDLGTGLTAGSFHGTITSPGADN
jgi:hypothetical protein